MKRQPVNKSASAQTFRNKTEKTACANVAPPPMRGGYRF